MSFVAANAILVGTQLTESRVVAVVLMFAFRPIVIDGGMSVSRESARRSGLQAVRCSAVVDVQAAARRRLTVARVSGAMRTASRVIRRYLCAAAGR